MEKMNFVSGKNDASKRSASVSNCPDPELARYKFLANILQKELFL
jgi:hypothetical protein